MHGSLSKHNWIWFEIVCLNRHQFVFCQFISIFLPIHQRSCFLRLLRSPMGGVSCKSCKEFSHGWNYFICIFQKNYVKANLHLTSFCDVVGSPLLLLCFHFLVVTQCSVILATVAVNSSKFIFLDVLNWYKIILRATPLAAGPHSREEGSVVVAKLC